MTREELIKWLRVEADDIRRNIDLDLSIPISYAELFEEAADALEQESCEDAVSRQAVLDLTGKSDWFESSNDYNDFVCAVCNLPSVIPRPQTKWISVNERLPEAGEYVGDVAKYYLVQNEYGDMLVARYTHSEYWEQIYQMKPISDKIVAWMPLPERYKADMEDEE